MTEAPLPGLAAVSAALPAAGGTPAIPGGRHTPAPHNIPKVKSPLPGLAAVSAALPEDPRKPGWRSREYLPHFDGLQIPQFITYHLADSLPGSAVNRIAAELADMPDDEQAVLKRERLQGYLDAGIGSCILRDPACARLVQEAFLHGDDVRYRLLAWTIMPNHVHVLIQPQAGWSLDRIIHSWKSFTAHAVLKTAAGTAAFPGGGHVWHREYWDRYIRDEQHFHNTIAYIEQNPVRAGLCPHATAWPWSHLAASR